MPCVLTEETNRKMFLTALDVPTEGVRHVQDETVAYVEDDSQGNGSLYITDKSVFYLTRIFLPFCNITQKCVKIKRKKEYLKR